MQILNEPAYKKRLQNKKIFKLNVSSIKQNSSTLSLDNYIQARDPARNK